MADLDEEPHKRIFGEKTLSQCKAHLDKLVDEQSKNDGEAQRDSGGGTVDSASEDEADKV
ncbi:unnamed protein product [Ascophyllum nodosum]